MQISETVSDGVEEHEGEERGGLLVGGQEEALGGVEEHNLGVQMKHREIAKRCPEYISLVVKLFLLNDSIKVLSQIEFGHKLSCVTI